MTPRRRLEVAILGFGAVFLGFLLYQFRPGRRPASRSPQDALPGVPASRDAGQATTVLKGFDYTETVRGQPLFRIKAERTVGYGPAAGLVPNAYALEKIALTVYPERGEPVTVHAERADYDQRTNAATLRGNVRWVDERGGLGETETLRFDPGARTLLAPERIHFSRGTFDLNAPSGRYDVNRRELVLSGPVSGAGTGEGSGGLSSLTADSAVYRRDQGVVELSGSVSAGSQKGDRLFCHSLVLKIQEEGQKFEWARAEGAVRGVLASAAIPGSKTPGGRRAYAADQATLFFAADEVRSISLAGKPASVEDPSRTVRAESIDLALAGGHPVSAHARGDVRVAAQKNVGRADSGSVGFSAAGEVETVELQGHVVMKGEDKSGGADKAVEVGSRQIWVFTAGPTSSAWVEGSGSRVSAARVEMDQAKRTVRAEGGARAAFVPGPSNAKGPTLVGDPTRPTYGKADRMAFDDANRVATLSGHASLWQDASSLFADDITLNDAQRTLVGVGNVRSVLVPAPAPDASGKRQDRNPSVVLAQRVFYREEPSPSEALFEGGVRLTRGPVRASAESAKAAIRKDRRIERVELLGNVTMSDVSTGRNGRADRAIDWPEQEKTVLEGAPAWVTDGEGNRVSGAVLTIAGRGRSVEITAPVGGKTETIHRTKT